MERLEGRLMLSAGPMDWTEYDVFVDGGAELTSLRSYAADALGYESINLLTASGTVTREAIIGHHGDTNGALRYPNGDLRVETFVMNGGSARSHSNVVGSAGREVIRNFFNDGGSYVGSCAGAFFADSYLHLGEWYVISAGGTGYQGYVFNETHEFVDDYLLPYAGTNSIPDVRFIGGPRFSDTAAGQSPGTVWLGDIVSGINKGTPALIWYQTDTSGLALLMPGHAEYSSSGVRLDYMKAIQNAAMDHAREEPAITPLMLDDLMVMDQPNQRLGDRQYHRYSVDIPAGLEQVEIQVVGMTGNVDLYVGADAHKDSHLYSSTHGSVIDESVIIVDPPAGLLYVSVYGDHTTVNGESYKLIARTDDVVVPQPQKLPIYQTFDHMPTEGWVHHSTHEGRIAVVDGRLRMDDRMGNNTYSTNASILHLDMGGHENVYVAGMHYQMRDEPHDEDGVFAVVDGQEQRLGLPSQNGLFSYMLPKKTTHLVFRQHDNYPAPSDGREWDDIRVEVVSPPVPQPGIQTPVYRYDFADGLPGASDGWVVNGHVSVVGDRLRMDAATDNVYQLNEAIVHLDFDASLVVVGHTSLKDEAHPADGVFASSNGTDWIKLDEDLVDGLLAFRVPAGNNRIKLSQYDNYQAPTDGREWYDIMIVG